MPDRLGLAYRSLTDVHANSCLGFVPRLHRMRRFLGFPILVLGVVFAAYVYYPAAFDRPTHFAAPAHVFDDLVLAPQIAPEPRPMGRSFAPQDPAFTTLDPQRSARLASAAPAPRATIALGLALRGRQPSIETPALVDDVAIGPWRSVVQTAPRPDAQGASSTRAQSSAARYELARNIQRELRRVGCYWGRIDGSWGVGSKRSMGEFMERVNAALPLEEPDIVFLSLLKAHPSETCGRSCPAGQSLDGAGRCLPDVILAQKAKRTGSDSVAGRLLVNGGFADGSGLCPPRQPGPAAPRSHGDWRTAGRPGRCFEPWQPADCCIERARHERARARRGRAAGRGRGGSSSAGRQPPRRRSPRSNRAPRPPVQGPGERGQSQVAGEPRALLELWRREAPLPESPRPHVSLNKGARLGLSRRLPAPSPP